MRPTKKGKHDEVAVRQWSAFELLGLIILLIAANASSGYDIWLEAQQSQAGRLAREAWMDGQPVPPLIASTDLASRSAD